MELGVLGRGDLSGLSGQGPRRLYSRGLYSREVGSPRRRRGEAGARLLRLLALKTEGPGAEAGREQTPLELPEGMQVSRPLDFSSLKPTSDFWPREL